MITFCDIHHHLLYGLDDGAQTREDMERMLQGAYRDYVDTVVATPHCTPGMREHPLETAREHLDAAQRYCEAQNLPITVVMGAEVLYTPALRNVIRDQALPTLGASRAVLVEFVPGIRWRELVSAVSLLTEYGYRPVLAHVERYRCLIGSRGRLKALKATGLVRYQINCDSLLKPVSLRDRIQIDWMLGKQLLDIVASDAHDMDARQTSMTETYQLLLKTVPAAYADALVSGTPRLLLQGG